MLRKLYKYEFFALFRILLPIYAAVVGFAVINRLSFFINPPENGVLETFQGFTVMAYVLSIISVLVVGIIVVITRFYKNLLTDEGYLSFTLPVRPLQHIVCKLICGVVVILINFAVVLLSLLILGIGTETLEYIFTEFKTILNYYTGQYGMGNVVLIITLGIIMAVAAMSQAVLMLYASMSIGQMFKNKVIGAAVSYIGFYFLIEAILLIVMLPIAVGYSAEIEAILSESISAVQILLVGLSLMYLVLGTGYLFITRYFLSKKLNLE